MLDPKEALGKVTKKKRVSAANLRKKKPQPGKQNKASAKRGAQNVKSDLLDDDGDGNNDDVGGNNDGGDDDDDDGNKIVGKPKVDDDKDGTSYHDNGEEDSDSDSEPSMSPDSDIKTEKRSLTTIIRRERMGTGGGC